MRGSTVRGFLGSDLPAALRGCGEGNSNGQSYVYDAENRLVKVTRTTDSQTLLEILYDAKGRRVESVEYVNPTTGQAYSLPRTTRHVYAENNAVEEYDVSTNGLGGHVNGGLREFVWGNRFPEPLGQFDWVARPPSGLKYHLRDGLGSVVGLANVLGVLWERYVYDPYGAPYIEQPNGQGGWTFTDGQGRPFASSWLGNPFMFTGQRYDPVVKLYHFKHRTLSPALGRWLQRDPLATVPRARSGYQDGMSLYEYVRSRPTVLADSSGAQASRPTTQMTQEQACEEAIRRQEGGSITICFEGRAITCVNPSEDTVRKPCIQAHEDYHASCWRCSAEPGWHRPSHPEDGGSDGYDPSCARGKQSECVAFSREVECYCRGKALCRLCHNIPWIGEEMAKQCEARLDKEIEKSNIYASAAFDCPKMACK